MLAKAEGWYSSALMHCLGLRVGGAPPNEGLELTSHRGRLERGGRLAAECRSAAGLYEGKAMITEVPFHLAGAAQPLILVPSWVNGRGPFDFILDTGAGTSLMSLDLARQLGIPTEQVREGTGAGGQVRLALGTVESLAVGQARRECLQVGMIDLSDLGRAVGARIDGDIGYNFLKGFVTTIDYRRSVLELADGDRHPNAVGSRGAGIPFRLGHPSKPLVLLPTLVNGQGPFEFALDTGSSTTVVSPELAQRLGIETVAIPDVTAGGGHRIKASAGRVGSLAIGGATVRDLPVMVADFLNMLSQVVGTKLDGIVGYNLLKEFRVTIDYPNGTLHLQ
jgi:predicted aspartyl protease